MNTVKKGDMFEEKIFNYFQTEINEDRFYAKKEFCRIYSKKGYYSKDRLKNIIFDIAIEIYLPHQEQYSILIIIECKDYSHKVPVDDVEELYAKVQQVSAAKAILVSSNSFQEGTFNFANSKSIGLLRYRNISDLDWELTRSPSSLVSYKYANNNEQDVSYSLRTEDYKNNYFDCYTFFNYKYTNSLQLFIASIIEEKLDNDIKQSYRLIMPQLSKTKELVEFIKDDTMEKITVDILAKINYKSGKVNLDDIETNYDINISYKQNLEKGVLGKINFKTSEIFIDNQQCETLARRRFTIAHELGHYILGHSKYLLAEKFYDRDFSNLENPFGIGIDDIVRMEWQANQFASYLLLPKEPFLKDFLDYAKKYKLENKGFGFIFLDKQQCNIDTFIKISSPLMQKYKVSRTVVKIRLRKLGLLTGKV